MSRRPLLVIPCVLSILFPTSSALAIPGTWSLLPNSPVPATAQRHDDLTFVDDHNGWLVNGDGDIYSTVDGGDTWTHLVDTGAYNRCVAFTDSLHGFVGLLHQSGGAALLSTTDSGVSWTPVALPNPVPQGLCGLWAASSQVVYGVGAYYGSPTLVKTTNNGLSWTTRDMSAYCGALVDCYFWHPDSGIAVGSTAPGTTRIPRVLLTTDGGYTWTVRWTGTRTRELCWKISFPARKIGYVSLENLAGTGAAYFLKTKDGGLSWEENLFSVTYRNCQGIGFADEETGWLGGWTFDTQATTDGGASWDTAGFGYNMNRFRFVTPSVGFACGDRVYRWTGNVSGIAESKPSPPRLLEQNHPNPFGGTTRFAYRVEHSGPVTLRLFDVQGRALRTLYAGTKSPGKYEITVNARDLPAGVYAYRLETPGAVETRRMWVIR